MQGTPCRPPAAERVWKLHTHRYTQVHSHTHTHSHRDTHTYTYTVARTQSRRSQAQTRTLRKHTQTRAHTHMWYKLRCTHIRKETRTLAQTDTHTHVHTRTDTHARTHRYAQLGKVQTGVPVFPNPAHNTHTQRYRHKHAHIEHAHTQTHTHTHRCTQIHTNTHKYTNIHTNKQTDTLRAGQATQPETCNAGALLLLHLTQPGIRMPAHITSRGVLLLLLARRPRALCIHGRPSRGRGRQRRAQPRAPAAPRAARQMCGDTRAGPITPRPSTF